jgi:anti-sigma regulatory factor (Ser/Thr protein kinase)
MERAGPLCTVLRIERLADAPVVRAVTLRRGLSAGLGRVRANEAALVASELATNIVKYGDGGEILLDVDVRTATFWIVALDRGPGLPSLEDYFNDGMTRGSQHAADSQFSGAIDSGGGAIERLADDVEWEPRTGGGNRISCRICIHRGGGPVGKATESERTL